jgi:hypothetical protein
MTNSMMFLLCGSLSPGALNARVACQEARDAAASPITDAPQ